MKRLWIVREGNSQPYRENKKVVYFDNKMKAKKLRNKLNEKVTLSTLKAHHAKTNFDSKEVQFFDKQGEHVTTLTWPALQSLWTYHVSVGPDHDKW